ncbi:MAG: 50S ribosomal protein L10 [Rhodospirillaceae bacterium]|nr:50S ribosomal protein L10 [Rhodospirillaceae bacterium]
MDRSGKEKLVTELQETLNAANLVVVTHQAGLSVAEVSDLRRKMRAAGAGFKVAKNRLAKLALTGTKHEDLGKLLKGPTALAYSADPVAAAKVAVLYAKSNDKLSIVGGSMGPQQTLGADGVKALATLPSLDELRSKLIAMLQTPATRLAVISQAPAGQLARVIGAYARKGEA